MCSSDLNPAAIGAYSNALVSQPEDTHSRLRLGDLLREQGNVAAATGILTQTVAMLPNFARAWYELGGAQKAEKNYHAASASFDHALRLDPRNPGYRYYKLYSDAMILAESHKTAESVAQLQKAEETLPSGWEAHFQLGIDFDAANKLDASLEEFSKAAQFSPNNPLTHLNHGVALAKERRFQEAGREFEETLRLDPNNKLAHNFLGKIQSIERYQPASR